MAARADQVDIRIHIAMRERAKAYVRVAALAACDRTERRIERDRAYPGPCRDRGRQIDRVAGLGRCRARHRRGGRSVGLVTTRARHPCRDRQAV